MKRFILVILLFGSLACGRTAQVETVIPTQSGQAVIITTPTAPTTLRIPAEYSALYNLLDTTLDAVNRDYPGQNSGKPPLIAAELAYANGNAGEKLLAPDAIAMVRQQLDGFSQMGVGGVVLAIKFPLVEPDFPRSAEYLQFFKQVANEVRGHRMKLLVESGALFSGTAF